MTAERYTAVFTGLLAEKKPREYYYLSMSEHPLGSGASSTLRCGLPPYEKLGRGIGFSDLPEWCQQLILDTYRRLWELCDL